ncbi:MAG: glycosyltransferase [Chitinophagaceae bacterium]|nr:MAG: glycosyltransferase [Chitinophagaceae bacterium]
MKLLSLVWFKVLPARFGGQKGTALFNRYLAEQAELVCLCSSDNVPDETLPYRLRAELPPGKRGVLRPSVWRKIEQVMEDERPTHLLLEYPYHAYAAIRAARRHRIKVVLHAHNIEFLRFRQLGHPAWRLLKAYEGWAFRNADLVLLKTETDRALAVQYFGIDAARTLLVPYGIEPNAPTADGSNIRRQWNIPDDALLLLFAGTLDYAPNAEAVQHLYKHLAPLLDAAGRTYRILICGRNRHAGYAHLDELQHPCIIRTGEVPSLAPYYAAADVFINPVLSGGGVQTKVIDALAAGCGTVTFDFGATGINRTVTGNLLETVPDGNWTEFAALLLKGSPPKTEQGRTFLDYYSWERIARRAIEVFQAMS